MDFDPPNDDHQGGADDNPPEPNGTPPILPNQPHHLDFFDPGAPGPSNQVRQLVDELIPDPAGAGRSVGHNPVNIPGNDIPSEPSIPHQGGAVAAGVAEPVPFPPAPVSHPSDPIEHDIDPVLFATVSELGYDDLVVELAIRRTNAVSAEAAVNWIIDHSNQSDFEGEAGEDESSSSENDEAEAMGAVGSAMAPVAAIGRSHKMVFIANMSLKMGTGKLAAQVGHACLGVYRVASREEQGVLALGAWRRHGEVKIVVKGQSTEQLMDLFKQAKDVGLYTYLVQDVGYTQIPPGSRTVLGVFGPVRLVDQITGQLKLL